MPTDTERREVAQRLRELRLDPWDDAACEIAQCAGIVCCNSECHGSNETPECTTALASRLADLIEPNRGSGGRTILCAHCESASWCGCEPGDEQGGCDFEPSVTEGEPPYNLYSLYEAIFRRHPRDKYAIEDDEVDELVDALLGICNSPGHMCIQRPQPSCDRDTPQKVAEEMFGKMRHSTKEEADAYDDMLKSKSVAIHPVDRDALLALADEIEGSDVTYCVSTQYVLDSYAERIRKALGVDDG